MNWQIDRWKRWKDIDRQTDVQWIDRKKWSDTPEISYCRVNLNKLATFKFLIFSALQNIILFNILNKLKSNPMYIATFQEPLLLFLSSTHYTLQSRDGIETPDETIVSICLEVFWINYLSSYGLPSIFWIFIVPTLFLPTKSCPITINYLPNPVQFL